MKVTREYICDYCHHDFQGLEQKSDEHIKHCPCCEQPAAKMIKETEEEGC